MSNHTQPTAAGLHSAAPAVIGARLNLNPQRGDEHAKLLWFVIISHTSWSADRPTWASDVTLSYEMGRRDTTSDKRTVKRALQRLKEADMLTVKTGHRHAHKTRKHGRLLVPRLAAPVKILIPTRDQMANLWITCREIRKRPASLVTLAVGLHALACHAAGHRVTGRTLIPGTMADARRFVGARKGHAWTQRVRDLETLGLITREGRAVFLEPMATWDQTARALAEVAERDITPAKHSPPVARVSECPPFDWPPAHVYEEQAASMDADPQWEVGPGWA